MLHFSINLFGRIKAGCITSFAALGWDCAVMLNKAGYTATPVACGWAGAVIELTKAFGQELLAQKAQKRRKGKKGTSKERTDRPTDRHSGV